MTTGIRLVFTHPKLRILVGLVWLAGLYIVPEGIAAPYAAKIAHGAAPVGWLMAAMPFGTAVGTYLFVRWVPTRARSIWMAPLGALSGLPYVLCFGVPSLPISLVLWMLAGLLFCYQVQVFTEFMRIVPDRHRGQAVGIAGSGLQAAQGLGVLLGGWAASVLGVGWAVAGAGLLGIVIAAGLGVAWMRAEAAEHEAAGAAPGAAIDAAPPATADVAQEAVGAEAATPLADQADAEPVRRGARHRLVNVGDQQQHRRRA